MNSDTRNQQGTFTINSGYKSSFIGSELSFDISTELTAQTLVLNNYLIVFDSATTTVPTTGILYVDIRTTGNMSLFSTDSLIDENPTAFYVPLILSGQTTSINSANLLIPTAYNIPTKLKLCFFYKDSSGVMQPITTSVKMTNVVLQFSYSKINVQ